MNVQNHERRHETKANSNVTRFQCFLKPAGPEAAAALGDTPASTDGNANATKLQKGSLKTDEADAIIMLPDSDTDAIVIPGE